MVIIMIESKSVKLFRVFNGIFLILIASTCVIPFLHVIAVSFSTKSVVAAGEVGLWPKGFTLHSYEYLIAKVQFWASFIVSIKRVIIGGAVNMFFIISIAYPLSKTASQLRFRKVYTWYFFFTALFSGGLIPQYMLIQNLKLMDTIWALVLPSAVGVFNVVLMLNFFRQIPKELEEAALVDGASQLRILVQIYLPCSLPAIATLTLFSIVGHWNSWFDGLLYSNEMSNYPLQSYLQTVIIGLDFSNMASFGNDYDLLKELSDRTLKSSQIIIATIPILMIYPFLQKYFVSGIVIGGVKG